jgi:NitT/TauT family transport system permease protein
MKNAAAWAAQEASQVNETSGRTRRGVRRIRDELVYTLLRILVLAVVLGTWQVLAATNLLNQTFVSSPYSVAIGFWDLIVTPGPFWSDFSSTVSATAIAFVIAVPLGTAIGLVLGTLPRVDRVLGPFLVPLNTVPRTALVPLFILWFGLGQIAKIVLAVSLVGFLLLFNARAGIRNVDPDVITVSRILGVSRLRFVLNVILPASVPIIFAGIRIGLTYCLLGVVSSEMIASRAGIGQLVINYGDELDVQGILSVVLALMILVAVVGALLDGLERYFLRWQ